MDRRVGLPGQAGAVDGALDACGDLPLARVLSRPSARSALAQAVSAIAHVDPGSVERVLNALGRMGIETQWAVGAKPVPGRAHDALGRVA